MKEARKLYIRQEYEDGDISEFDWGTVNLILMAQVTRTTRWPSSAAKTNNHVLQNYISHRTHLHFRNPMQTISLIVMVYFTLWSYDNMRVAVRKFVGLMRKSLQEALTQLSLYYGYYFRFCNIGVETKRS